MRVLSRLPSLVSEKPPARLPRLFSGSSSPPRSVWTVLNCLFRAPALASVLFILAIKLLKFFVMLRTLLPIGPSMLVSLFSSPIVAPMIPVTALALIWTIWNSFTKVFSTPAVALLLTTSPSAVQLSFLVKSPTRPLSAGGKTLRNVLRTGRIRVSSVLTTPYRSRTRRLWFESLSTLVVQLVRSVLLAWNLLPNWSSVLQLCLTVLPLRPWVLSVLLSTVRHPLRSMRAMLNLPRSSLVPMLFLCNVPVKSFVLLTDLLAIVLSVSVIPRSMALQALVRLFSPLPSCP